MRLDETMQAQATGAQRSDANGQRTAADPQAWRREMERTQAQSWFHRFDHPSGSLVELPSADDVTTTPALNIRRGAPPSGAMTAMAGRSPQVASPLGLWVPPMPAHGGVPRPLHAPYASYAPQVAPGSLAGAAAPPAVRPAPAPLHTEATLGQTEATIIDVRQFGPRGAGAGRAPRATAPDAGGAAARPPHAAKGDGSKLPVRVHVEGDAQRATVWLGVDAAADLDLTSLTRSIGRWLASTGYGKPTWICNGRTLEPEHGPAAPDSGADDAAARPMTRQTHFIDQPHGESA